MRRRWIAIVTVLLVGAGAGVVALREPHSSVWQKPVTLAESDRQASAPSVSPAARNLPAIDIPAASSVVTGPTPKADETHGAPANPARPTVAAITPVEGVQLTRMADGALLVDELYIVHGQGTAADPYVVTWDLLLSASETFAPADGRWEVPRRLKWLDGKQLQVKGFVTSPTRATTSDHVLLTWSAQDACCQGPPANPCQAIEVKLERSITLETHVLIGVTVEGTFKVHPRMAGGLRMSLFHFENARVVALGER